MNDINTYFKLYPSLEGLEIKGLQINHCRSCNNEEGELNKMYVLNNTVTPISL